MRDGVEAPSQLVAQLGAEHALAGLCGTFSWVTAPGHIRSIGASHFIKFGELDNVLLAPHCIAWTDELFRDLGRTVCRGMLDLAGGRVPRGVVNREVLDRPGFQAKWKRLLER